MQLRFWGRYIQEGFFRVKGKTTYIKTINDEIILSVSLVGNNEEYNVFTGISTVYDKILKILPDKTTIGFYSIWELYITSYWIYGRDHEYAERIKKFKCGYDNESIISSMNYAYEQFELIVLPLLNKTIDLKTMFWYFDHIHVPYFSKKLYLKLENYDDYFAALQKHLTDLLQVELKYHLNRVTEDNLKDKEKSISDRIQNGYIDFLQEIISNSEKRKDVFDSFNDNKIKNMITINRIIKGEKHD